MSFDNYQQMSFRTSGQKSSEETAKENKDAKVTKKNIKEIIKINKEVVEEITKTNAEASDKVQNQIAKIGISINKSNNDLQRSIGKLTETLLDPLNDNQNEPMMKRN